MESHDLNPREQAPAPAAGQDAREANPGVCRAPQLVPLGTATELMRRDGTGHLVDGAGGWYVWGDERSRYHLPHRVRFAPLAASVV